MIQIHDDCLEEVGALSGEAISAKPVAMPIPAWQLHGLSCEACSSPYKRTCALTNSEFRLGVAQFLCKTGDLHSNLAEIEQLVEAANQEDLDVLVLPELSLTGYAVGQDYAEAAIRLDQQGPVLQRIQELSERVGLALGFVEESSDGLFYNSAGFWYGGELLGLHRKIYPPNYGQFDEGKWFAKGDEVRAFDTPWGRFAMLICADAWHPTLPCLAAHDGADVIFHMAASPTNGVREDIDTLEGWRRLNQTNAMTLGAYVVFTNHVGTQRDLHFKGGSHIAGPCGKIVATCDEHPGIAAADLRSERIRHQQIAMPFRRDDDLNLTIHMAEKIKQRKQASRQLDTAVKTYNASREKQPVAQIHEQPKDGVVARIGMPDDQDAQEA